MSKEGGHTELGPGTGLRRYKADGTSLGVFGVKRPSSTSERLIIDMVPSNFACFGLPEVFTDETISRLPEQLAKAGVPASGWEQHMIAIRNAVQMHSTPACKELLFCLTIVGFCYLDYKLKNMNEAVSEAVAKMNRELLEPHGCYAKTQFGAYNSLRTHKRITWLSVAVTPAESAILREEPHLFKYNFSLTEMKPYDENECNYCYSTKVWGAPIVL